jgi:hypothetical protein
LARVSMHVIQDRHGTYYVQRKVPERLQEAVARVLNADEPPYARSTTAGYGTKRKCRNAPGISEAGGRPAVPSACRPQLPLTRSGHPGRARSPLPQLSPCIWGKCKGAGGRVNASIVVRAGSQSGLRLVLRALQTSRNLFGATCSRDLLCLRAADGERSDIRSQRVCGRASHAAFRIAGNGDESSEREVCYCGD